MAIISMISIVIGVLLILHSSSLSGKVLSPDDIFRDGGLRRVVIHIFRSRPFAGYKQDIRILIYGVVGLTALYGGVMLFLYFTIWVYSSTWGSR